MSKSKIIVKKKKVPSSVHGTKRKKSQQTEERRRKQLQALELRQSGATYQMIADSLSLHDASHARKYVNWALDRLEMDAAKNVVQLDLSRLDEFQMRCTHALRQNGDLGQIDRVLRIMEFRYRLLGIGDETVRQLQADHGITNVHNTTNVTQNVVAAPETQEEFVSKMMRAVGVDPDSEEAKQYVASRSQQGDSPLPMAPGSANDAALVRADAPELNGEDIAIGEIVEDTTS